ncbi:MAG: aminotransferase class III-fold pyridoxal phosphate-dependent enzyme [Thermotogae bacterium]|nr:aminotransferase class III-fold pyridoxal phosphate-dependent enzyme [Thermotogota bacterium]
MRWDNSMRLFDEARGLIPWGVQTGSKKPDFLFFGEGPVYVKKAFGSHIMDVDGNEYVDYVMGLGAIILGYNISVQRDAILKTMSDYILTSVSSPLEIEIAKKIVALVPSAEMVRFFKTGAEATSAAIRLVRHIRGRDKILACGYFGWHDWANSGSGIPVCIRELTERFDWKDVSSLEGRLKSDEYAAVIVEPVIDNEPDKETLEYLRKITTLTGTVLIFDEIKTGFRFSPGGAQEYFGVIPDITILGKGIANGMPLSAVAGRRDLMKKMEDLWISTTYGSEALSFASAAATLNMINKTNVEKIWELGKELMDGLKSIIYRSKIDAEVVGFSPMSRIKFAKEEDERTFIRRSMESGILFKRGGYNFISMSHTRDDIQRSLDVAENALKGVE